MGLVGQSPPSPTRLLVAGPVPNSLATDRRRSVREFYAASESSLSRPRAELDFRSTSSKLGSRVTGYHGEISPAWLQLTGTQVFETGQPISKVLFVEKALPVQQPEMVFGIR